MSNVALVCSNQTKQGRKQSKEETNTVPVEEHFSLYPTTHTKICRHSPYY